MIELSGNQSEPNGLAPICNGILYGEYRSQTRWAKTRAFLSINSLLSSTKDVAVIGAKVTIIHLITGQILGEFTRTESGWDT